MTQALHLTPPTAPLPMPTQVLSRQPGRRFASQDSSPLMARLLVFGGSLALLMVASYQMYLTLPLNEATLAAGVVSPWMMGSLWLLLALFSITFGWVALTAMAALAGFLYGQDRYRAAPDAALQSKTVLLMPVYNEDPVSAAGALAAMAEELGDLGVAEHFEIFVLSDTVNPDILSSEAAAVACLRERLAGIMPVWYRRRQQNTARKAGNIRDFVSRWGERYDYMVVLDADSLMAGSTLATLVREMDADPRAGILQTLPRLYGGETLYARLQQFAGVIYGPVFARGLNAWQGLDGNYWGHNAILRVRAMAESAGLPRMPGPGPFGGEILSHDFVEAALIRRAGWTVRMLPGLPGSWEECPPTLLDAAVRDRRWAQGNVQHLAVIRAQGLRWPNRAHMLMGIMNYVTSPIWLALVVVGLLLSTQLYQPSELLFDAESMLGVFLVTMLLLFLPKLLGFFAALLRRGLYQDHGQQSHQGQGRFRLLISGVLELLFSILQAPIVMMLHSQHLWEIFRGQDSGWSAQQRRGRVLPWLELFRRHGGQTVMGLLMTALLVWMSSPLLYWMLPMIVGLVLAIPLSAVSGSARVGRLLARYGIFDTPEEESPPAIMKRRMELTESFATAISSSGYGGCSPLSFMDTQSLDPS